MFVEKRDGKQEKVSYDKIQTRINKLSNGLDKNFIDAGMLTQKVVAGIFSGIKTRDLDNLLAESAANMTLVHSDYALLAGRISISNLHKETKDKFSLVVEDLYNYINPKTGEKATVLSEEFYKTVQENSKILDETIKYEREMGYTYFGFKTLEKSYLLKIDGKVVERVSHLLMRTAVGIHGNDIPAAIETYNLLSQRYFIHATPTLFNAGTVNAQYSSCFLTPIKDDSIVGIYDTMKDCALISKHAGGIGLSVSNIRSADSYIKGNNGYSNGIIPMLRVFNNTARYVNQGSRRAGSFAIYLEPWHADIFEFIELKKNTGAEELRARDLFYALWIPDLFMQRVQEDGMWSLMDPNQCPNLNEVHSDAFNELYLKYESEGKFKTQIPAQKLWKAIIVSQIETGGPFILYKDACNSKSNQQNLGTIKSSNLCTEIIQYSSPTEIATCNLSSIGLAEFVKNNGQYDFKLLHKVAKVVTRNLNKIIDVNYYPVEDAKTSNIKHRPIGVGLQGLADVFFKLKLPFDSEEAKELNKRIFETIYHGCLEASNELAQIKGYYETYVGSPIQKGILQQDLWGVAVDDSLWNWTELREKIKKYGVYNSLLTTVMPTASSSNILGNTECIEPINSNFYIRRVLSGEFQLINQYLVKDLVKLDLWNDDMRNEIVAARGSIQNISSIPEDLKNLYKTVWEISQKSIIDMAVDRAAFIDQSQSLNIHMADPNYKKLTSLHFYGWKKGLKTGSYYIRTKPAVNALQFSVKQETLEKNKKVEEKQIVCTEEVCTMCSS